ncbi:MAG: TOBE domain-containing protein, partial [Candidatus Poribacteria bacterium]
EAFRLGDRIAVMKDGKIIQIGTPREIYNTPINSFVADFIGETNFIQGKLKAKSADFYIFDSLIGQITATGNNIGKSDNLICSVRPESISISDMPSDNVPNQFEARIVSVTYLGDVEEYWVKVRNLVDMKVVLYNPGKYERKSGDKVFVQFSPQNAIILAS